jgi:hypothetical protein
MPVKKQKANKKVKRDIKKAVEQLPGLMVEHVKFKEIERPAELQKLPAPTRYEEIETRTLRSLPYGDEKAVRQKKIWLWTGVTIFSAVIFLMWGWNMHATFQDSFANTKKQPGITETAQTTWQETMKTIESNKPSAPAENLDEIKNQIKNNLVSFIYVQASTTTSTAY